MSPNFQSSARPEDLMYIADTPERDPKATSLLKKSMREFDNKPLHLSVLQLPSCIFPPWKKNGEESKQPVKPLASET